MRKYTKAYYLKDLRKFDGWEELERDESAEELTDDSIVYVQDNFTVVWDNPFDEENYLFKDVTEAWEKFLKEDLGFEIPEDLRYMYEEEEQGEAPPEAATAATGEAASDAASAE